MSRPAGRLRWLPRDLLYFRLPPVASRLRRAWVRIRHPHARIEFGRDVYLGPGFTVHMPHEATLIVGDRVQFRRDSRIEIDGGGAVTIGAGTIFAQANLIQCSTRVEIGKRCVFAYGATIVDGSHRFRDPETPMLEQGYDFRPITIGAGASVMAKATVIAGIGRGSFIGANAVVTREIPAHSLAVGIPARVVETLAVEVAGDR